ncbi:MAG: hypothetical protein OXI30_18430 [Chloroflexota bacterium]|nr:hypothetical protein [Chloroflexota bacterium]
MRHLWTTVTTEHTVTHDAGEPEWLDLPLTDFVLPASLNLDGRPVEVNLDPAWLILSNWLLDEVDVGRPLMPNVEIRDPLGLTLYNNVPALNSFDNVIVPRVFSTVPLLLDLSWHSLWYTVPGPYTFIVRWTGSRASRENGQFALNITDIGSGANHE